MAIDDIAGSFIEKGFAERVIQGSSSRKLEAAAIVNRNREPMNWDPDLKTSVNIRRCFAQIDGKYSEITALVRGQDKRSEAQKKILVEIKAVFERLTEAHGKMVDDFGGRLASMEKNYQELNELFRTNATFETVEVLRAHNLKLQQQLEMLTREQEDGVEQSAQKVG